MLENRDHAVMKIKHVVFLSELTNITHPLTLIFGILVLAHVQLESLVLPSTNRICHGCPGDQVASRERHNALDSVYCLTTCHDDLLYLTPRQRLATVSYY